MNLDKGNNRMYQVYVLTITTTGLAFCELGRYLPGVTSRDTAKDVHYGDKACVLNVSLGILYNDVPQPCESAKDAGSCMKLELNGTSYCEWDYNGLGYEYQILAGPGFNFPMCVVTILMGFLGDRYNRLYQVYVLTITTTGLAFCELGRNLPGVTSRETARDVHYGDKACVLNVSLGILYNDVPQPCESAKDAVSCMKLELNGTSYCEWDYNGLGYEYQILAGPGFNFPMCVVTILMGFLGDRYNRVLMMAACMLLSSISVFLQGAATQYWHLLALRTTLAVGESGSIPFGSSVLSDVFPESVRAIVMSVFNCASYFGFGMSFPVGHYLSDFNVWDLGWRFCYYFCGVVILIIAVLTLTIREPERTLAGEEKAMKERGEIEDTTKTDSLLKVLLQPKVSVMCFASALRYIGGCIFAFDCDLYYRQYFPGVDLALYLFIIFCILGSIGVLSGGLLSDLLTVKYGTAARVAVIAVSQILATPFAFGSVYFDPLWAMITLGLSYFFAEMWYGNLFAVIVEIVPVTYRSSTISFIFCVMNLSLGLAAVAMDPVEKAIGFREALYIFYVAFHLFSSLVFFLTIGFIKKPRTAQLAFDNKAMSVEIEFPTENGDNNYSSKRNSLVSNRSGASSNYLRRRDTLTANLNSRRRSSTLSALSILHPTLMGTSHILCKQEQ